MIPHYTEITIDEARAHIEIYITTPTRAAQNEQILFTVIQKSINKKTRDKLRNNAQDYIVLGIKSGSVVLRFLIAGAHTDTNTTLRNIYNQINDFLNYFLLINYDIAKFNIYIKSLQTQFLARNTVSTQLFNSIFTVYTKYKDQKFVRYIEFHEDSYDDSNNDITEKRLMTLAATKYDNIVKTETWKVSSTEQQKIQALKTELVQVKTAHKKKIKTPKKPKIPKTKKSKQKKKRETSI